jgi:glyceraldehyde 3-phosphate dehydrogenase
MNILLNGVGRIGKSILRLLCNHSDLNIIAINELNTNIKNIAYSINYDSTYGRFEKPFSYTDDTIYNDTRTIKVLNEQSLADIDYKKYNIDAIIDASGVNHEKSFLDTLDVKKIFITHPMKEADINVVLGVNENKITDNHKVISTSSCNATALAPLLQLIEDNYGIEVADIVTIHPLLNHQKTLDSNCVGSSDRGIECNFEFGRSATQNIIPSKTTTITACSYVNEKFNHNTISSNSLRVPTPTVGAINLSCVLDKELTKEELLVLLEKYEKTQKYKILLCNEEELVSCDFQAQEYTTIIDLRYIEVLNKRYLKCVVWYDNEYGYASKVVDIIGVYNQNNL